MKKNKILMNRLNQEDERIGYFELQNIAVRNACSFQANLCSYSFSLNHHDNPARC